MIRGLPLLMIAAGCTDESYLVVTVAGRPAVHDAVTLDITQKNAGTMRTDTLPLEHHTLPVTFSIQAPGRVGALELSIVAHDADGLLVGLGSATTTIDAKTAAVMLEASDFVVNTEYAADQFLTTDFETNGFQLGATTDGNWTAAFRNTCTDTCQVFGRRFDSSGVPVRTALAAGTNEFTLTTSATTSGAYPAIAGAGASTLAAWDFADTVGMGHGVACRSIDAQGNGNASQLAISTDDADTVSVSPLTNGNFAVVWQVYTPAVAIRTIIAKADCSTVLANPVTVSTIVGTSTHRAHAAASGGNVLYAWITDDDVHVRPANNAATFAGGETTLVAHTAASTAEAVRVVPLGGAFAVIVRWAATNGSSPGKIEMYRASVTGAAVGSPVLITDKSGSEFGSGYQGFGVAARSDGALFVVWHQCDDGSAGTCDGNHDVLGRILRPTGVPVGDPFVIPTATTADQVNPSVIALSGAFAVAWNDSSKTPPDTDGTAVRARVIYPPYDDATAVLGAPCGGSLPACGMGLACSTGTDNVPRCYQTCTPPTCAGGGTCSPVDATTYACTF